MKNTLVVIQCRFGSTRLPGKILYPLCGVPMVVFLLRRLKNGLTSKGFQLVLATTHNKEDDPVAKWSEQEGVPVVRGEEDNVLKRYVQCLEQFPTKSVIRVTGDNPLTCPQIIKDLVAKQNQCNAAYIGIEDFPYGSGADLFHAESLVEINNRHVCSPEEMEHINLYILNRPELFNTSYMCAKDKLCRPDIKVTVDTHEDWKILNSICSPDEINPWNISLEDAIERMDSYSV